MIRRLLNRLLGRAGASTDAINAYVGGNASEDELKLVEQMLRDDAALEKDIATQKALLEVLSRLGAVEAPRSFAITPEMVAAAEASESRISRLAELFAPQRKLALAPAVLAGFAALTVALLTIGDITGVVEQSGRRESSAIADVGVAESAAAAPVAGDLAAGAPEIATAIEKASDADSVDQTESQALPLAATAAPAATPAAAAAALAEAEIAPAAMEALESSALGEDAGTEAPPSLSAAAPIPEEADPATEFSADDEAARRELPDPAADAGAGTGAADGEVATGGAGAGEGAAEGALAGAGEGALAGAGEGAFAGAGEGALAGAGEGALAGAGEGAGTGNGISLPLWQLQVALAVLALAVIGAWAGLRRVRRD